MWMPTLRAALVSSLCVVAAICMRSWGGDLPWQLWMPAGLLILASLLTHHRHVGSQMLVRAVLWSNTILGAMAIAFGNRGEQPIGAILLTSTAAALVLLGRHGLVGDAKGNFVPVAFRATLISVFVMALADAQTMIFFGSLEDGNHGGHTLVALGAALVISIVGLYRLRVWGLLANAVACVALIGAAALGLMELPGFFVAALVVSAALQLVLVGRLGAAIVLGATRARSSR